MLLAWVTFSLKVNHWGYLSSIEICDIQWNQPQILRNQNLIFLANLCNSTAIEMHDDIIRVSHGFDGCQMLEYIADSVTSSQRTGKDDITNFLWNR